jgi:hypothetical protein
MKLKYKKLGICIHYSRYIDASRDMIPVLVCFDINFRVHIGTRILDFVRVQLANSVQGFTNSAKGLTISSIE